MRTITLTLGASLRTGSMIESTRPSPVPGSPTAMLLIPSLAYGRCSPRISTEHARRQEQAPYIKPSVLYRDNSQMRFRSPLSQYQPNRAESAYRRMRYAANGHD